MKKKSTAFLGICFWLGLFLVAFEYSYSQSSNCDDYLIYKEAFQKLQQNNKDTLVIEVGYSPNEFTLKDLKSTDFLTTKEIRKVELVSEIMFEQCEKLKTLLNNLERTSPLCKDDGSYMKRYYSRPFYVSETKAILFLSFSSKNKKYSGGKKTGADIIAVYKRVGEDWHFHEQKMLSVF